VKLGPARVSDPSRFELLTPEVAFVTQKQELC
jgi:hypothetical protein